MKRLSFAVAAAGLACLSAGAQSGEIRFGAAVTGMELIYGVLPQANTFDIGHLDSVQVDVFFDLPDPQAFRWMAIGNPRLELGGLVNLAGRESSVHAGINWHYPLFESAFYIEAGLGVGLHNGASNGAVAPMRNLGCPFGIHYTYGVGANLGEHFSITGRFQHLSHAYICSGPNEGLNSVSVALGYRY